MSDLRWVGGVVLSSMITVSAYANRLYSDPAALPAPPSDAPGFPSRAARLDALPGFQNPPPGYGEVPFWWWTGDPLDKDRLKWQIEELHKKGISGMQVNYAHKDTPGWPTYPAEPEIFSDEWWEMWRFVAGECGQRNMGIGLSGYTLDWPNNQSLISRTIYNDPAIQGRELGVALKERVKAGQSLARGVPGDTVAVQAYPVGAVGLGSGAVDLSGSVRDGKLAWTPDQGEWEVWVYASSPKAGTINPIHPQAGPRVVEKFFQRFQDNAPGQSADGLNYFFHDELQFGVGDLLWTGDLPEQFLKRKGYSLFEALPAMFQEVGPRTAKYRLDYMDVKMQLAQERYFMPIFQWHWSRGKIYGCDQSSRGRNPAEFGDYFSSVRWYTAPGHDTPGGQADLIKGKVSSSIAHLYKRPRVWLEGYHSLGWSATPENLMFATRENYIYGCNLLNLHGLYYTTHGGYWEWAPPCYHFRMPYWEHMGTFLKYFERLSYVMSQGVHQSDIAVLYPVSPGQARMGGGEATSLAFQAGERLFGNGYDFVFMDFESLDRAEVRGGRLHVADASYRVLVLPAMRALRWSTLRKAQEFFRQGGVVVALDALPEASDHAGSEDPELDAAVKELFGCTAVEAKSGARPEARASAAGGQGVALLPGGGAAQPAPARRYDGGFAGHWAWSKEPAQNVYFKAVWKTGSAAPKAVRLLFFCDNEGQLYVNGKAVGSIADYATGWTGEVALKDGDVITVDGRDHDEPGRRGTAGMFLAAARDGKTIFSTVDLRYTLSKPAGEAWRTDPSLAGLAAVDVTNVHEAHRGAPPVAAKDLWARLLEVVARAAPRDVQAAQPVKAMHRKIGPRDVYLVMGAPKGSDCAFRAMGRAELWDPWTGQVRPLHVVSREENRTTVRMPLEAYESALVVFTPQAAELAIPETTLAEVTRVETGGGVKVTGYASAPGPQTATVKRDGKTVLLRGEAPQNPAPLALDGPWESTFKPTMDNRWGDFRFPVGDTMIGAEARLFRYALETTARPEWKEPGLDDSTWANATYGFGLKFWKLGPLPETLDPAAVEARLAKLQSVDPAVPVEIEGRSYTWTPYEFSWRLGREGDPGAQGYHGLKENISDDFIRLGNPQFGAKHHQTETTYGKEAGGGRYYLWTSARVPQAMRVRIVAGGQSQPAAVYLAGAAVASLDKEIDLPAGSHPLLIRYDSPGRRHFVMMAAGSQAAATRAPLSMTWYDHAGRIAFDAMPSASRRPVGWYRFAAPPGLQGMTVTAQGDVQAWADGKPMMREADGKAADGAIRYRFRLPGPVKEQARVAMRIEMAPGCYGGSALPEPVRLDCGRGLIALGDWSKQSPSLRCYSGGIQYEKTVVLTAEQAARRVTLELGGVVATAEVWVNGKKAGVRVAPPWKLDITEWVKAGENRIAVTVFNTLANHYTTIPSNYRGDPKSGLMGPVRLIFDTEVTLSE